MPDGDALGRFEVPARVPAAIERATVGSRRRARRTRSPHPGIVIMKPDAEHASYRARYEDPDSGRTVKERLDPQALPTLEARADWAKRKAKALAKRRMDLASGSWGLRSEPSRTRAPATRPVQTLGRRRGRSGHIGTGKRYPSGPQNGG